MLILHHKYGVKISKIVNFLEATIQVKKDKFLDE
jgi:hypothetical protein